jgi:Ca-activated chloride channel family protein
MRTVRVLSLLVAVVGATALGAATWMVGWDNLWSTPDQRGQRLFESGRYQEAAHTFAAPMWIGAAQFRNGDFKAAAETFGGLDTAESAYDQGNALLMSGKYQEAIARYDRALALRPGWPDATANRELARLRGERIAGKGADAGDQREGADKIVFDRDKKEQGGQDTQTVAEMSDAAARALWLQRIEPRPADFLQSRFLYQLQGAP